MKRTLAVLLCFMLCTLCSCGVFVWRGGGNTPTAPSVEPPTDTGAPDTTPPEEGQEYPTLAALPDDNFGGATVVLTASSAGDYLSDGDTTLDAALAARNSAVESKYRVGVAIAERTVDQIYSELTDSVRRGAYYSDLISVPMSQFARFVQAGLLTPLSDNAAIDLSAPYYAQTDAFTHHGAIYGVAGAANARAGYAYCVYFNARLATEAGVDLYAESDAGAWTWERFSQLLSGRVGSGFAVASDAEFINCIFTSWGLQYTHLTEGGRVCDYVGEGADAVMATARSILQSGAQVGGNDPAAAFAAGQSFFYIGTLAQAAAFANMPDSFGVLPLPNGTAGAQTHSYVSADMPVLCIPVGASAYAGTVLAGLCAASADTMDGAYLTYLMAYFLRDNASALCARTVGAGMTYDFAYVFGAPFDDVADCTYWSVQAAVLDGKRHDQLYRTYLPDFEKFVG